MADPHATRTAEAIVAGMSAGPQHTHAEYPASKCYGCHAVEAVTEALTAARAEGAREQREADAADLEASDLMPFAVAATRLRAAPLVTAATPTTPERQAS